MHKILSILFILFALSVSTLFAQTKRVHATGCWEIANITPEAARSKAIEDAKNNALQNAGISEFFAVMNTSSISIILLVQVALSFLER